MKYLIALLLLSLCCSARAADGNEQYFSKAGVWPSTTNLVELIHPNRGLALQSLEEFRALVDDADYADLGFESLDDAKSAILGTPLAVYWIGLNDLREYSTNKSPATLLRTAAKIIYPITAKEQVRASLTLQERDGKWLPSDFGFADFSMAVAGTRQRLAELTHLSLTNFFAVEVPSLNLFFIAHQWENKTMLTPVSDVPALHLSAGRSLPALEVLHLLLPVARSHNGNPG